MCFNILLSVPFFMFGIGGILAPFSGGPDAKQDPVGVFCFGVVCLLIGIAIIRSGRSSKQEYAIPNGPVDQMTGAQFESWCAHLLVKNGFTIIQRPGGPGDQGADIIARRNGISYAIQCKRYSNKLGNKPVQEVYTAKTIYNCDKAVVMTNNYFTEGAFQAAQKTGVELWDRSTLLRLQNSSK